MSRYRPEAIERTINRAATLFAAGLLRDLESHIPANAPFLPGDDLFAAVRAFGEGERLGPLPDLEYEPGIARDRQLDRFARLLRVNRSRRHDEHVGALPDPLRLAAMFAANPADPTTHLLTKSLAVRSLTAVYDVAYDGVVVNMLREEFDRIQLSAGEPGSMLDISNRTQHGSQARLMHFLADCLCVGGWCDRVASLASQQAFLREWLSAPATLGVAHDNRERRTYRQDKNRPQLWLRHPLPSFGELLRFAFAKPTGLPGFDQILGGLLPTLRLPASSKSNSEPAAAIITLIAGRPGSGKTSLATAIMARLFELGSPGLYLSVEEPPADLGGRMVAGGWPIARAFGEAGSDNLRDSIVTVPVARLDSEHTVAEWTQVLEKYFPPGTASSESRPQLNRVIVIDSITTILSSGELDPHQRRKQLIAFLKALRSGGGAVFLVGTVEDAVEADLAYLVDNVLILDVLFAADGDAVRSITVEKTRQQLSSVGRHEFTIHGHTSVDIHPSLPARLEKALAREDTDPRTDRILIPKSDLQDNQAQLDSAPVFFRDQSHILIAGVGSTSKARLAIGLALRQPVAIASTTATSDLGRSVLKGAASDAPRRTLIISFLYSQRYYADAARDYFRTEYPKRGTRELDQLVSSSLVAFVIPPGTINPARVIDEVERLLSSADLDGRPFDSAVIDGVHNIMVQFPNLERAPLFLPTLLTSLRKRPMGVFLTFTRFSVDGGLPNDAGVDTLRVSQQLLYHLLVSRFDYVLWSHRLSTSEASDRSLPSRVIVRVETSIERKLADRMLSWSPESFGWTRLNHGLLDHESLPS